jgi:type II secretory pathway component PulJ
MNRKNQGFTILELLIFIAIFALVMVGFVTILIAVTRVQTQQLSTNEVTEQSQYLLQQLQYYIERSSLVQENANSQTSTLELRMANSSTDPTYITLSGGIVYLQEGTGAQQPLTSSKVTVSGLTFTKRSNAPSHDSVDIAFTMSYNTSNVEQAFSQMLQTSVVRVSAASFDSSLLPSTTAEWSLGASTNLWTAVYASELTNNNEEIYFSGSNVGIGPVSSPPTPSTTLEVFGGNIEDGTTGDGLILRDSSGACWLIKPNTSGTLTTATSTC